MLPKLLFLYYYIIIKTFSSLNDKHSWSLQYDKINYYRVYISISSMYNPKQYVKH